MKCGERLSKVRTEKFFGFLTWILLISLTKLFLSHGYRKKDKSSNYDDKSVTAFTDNIFGKFQGKLE